MLPPLIFHPMYQERIWGGRNLEGLFGRALPAGGPIGESWEISDRPEAVSIVAEGPCAGRDLRWLMENQPEELMGARGEPRSRFPLLIKLLDARERLSLQVHPPAESAARLGGEPKTEFWYIAHAEPGAELFVGLKRGVTREEFKRRLHDQTVAECFHRVAVRLGDAMFLPSGRVHAIGAGIVLFEVQQNSDTTYRVYDWGRVDSDGKARELHVAQAMESIDFQDYEPALLAPPFSEGQVRRRRLVSAECFLVDHYQFEAGDSVEVKGGRLVILGLIDGAVTLRHPGGKREVRAGEFVLIPACTLDWELAASAPANLLWTEPGG